MAVSDATEDVWARALLRIGEVVTVTSTQVTTPDTTATKACGAVYDDIVKKALESHAWSWATKQGDLTDVTDTVSYDREGWDYAYTLPADCVRVLDIIYSATRRSQLATANRVPWRIMLNDDDDGRLLVTDIEAGEIDAVEYVAHITDVSAWPRRFLEAIVWRLAAEMALALKKDIPTYRAYMVEYENELSLARASDEGQSNDVLEPETPSVTARG